jgi:hypothetical protein
MNRTNVVWVLRADGIFNFLAGLALVIGYTPLITLIGWPLTDTPIYANVLGAATMGLALVVWFAAYHPPQSRDSILATVLTKSLVGAIILYWVFVARIALPSPWLLPAAVGVQVLFVIGEGLYFLLER